MPTIPGWVKSLLIALVLLSFVPLALIARARVSTSPDPRIHIVHDMDHQEKFRPQEENALFADGRAMRLPVAGTIARGELQADDHLYRGTVPGTNNKEWARKLPPSVTVDEELLARGQERYAIHCAPCHGLAGHGDGPVHRRALQLVNQKKPGMAWQAPKNLHSDPELILSSATAKKPAGYVYHVITNGFNNMNGYKAQISVEDRWAIVAYVAALQRSQGAPQ
ncbi:MAG: cytochrome c [Planctomycetes bacterium]|nr:cytochrome c [Planctomycetota bacterium]